MELSYVIIIISSLLGVIGLVFKTKKDEKGGAFNPLTPFGFLVLVLLVASFVVSIYTQRDKDKKAKEEKMAALEEKKAAVDKAKRDSISARKNFQIDSLGHELTIKALKEEASLNYFKRINDSLQFKISYAKSQEILNPLFPLKISASFIIDLTSLTEFEKDELHDFLKYFSKKFKNNKAPKNFVYEIREHREDYEPSDTVIEVENFHPQSFSLFEDRVLNDFNMFVYRKLIPGMLIYIYKDKRIRELDRRAANLFMIVDPFPPNQPTIDYTIYNDKFATIDLTLENPKFERNDGEMKSILSVQNGLMAVQPFAYFCPKVTLTTFDLYCGANYNYLYRTYFDRKKLRGIYVDNKYDSVYLKRGDDK